MSSEIIDEFVRQVDEQIAAGKIRMLFWTCRYPTHRGVDWTRHDDGTASPRCLTCNAEGARR